MNLETTKNEIISRFEKSREWLFVIQTGKSFALQKDEIEVAIEREKILLSFQTAEGFQTWRIADCKFREQKILFGLSRNFGTEKIKAEFIPRTAANEIAETVELARLEKANKIARQFADANPKTKLIRVSLKHEHGRLAHVFLENSHGKTILALCDVSETLTPERLLTTAILEYEKLSRRKKNPVEKIWILAVKKAARSLQKILAMLRKNWQSRIEIFQMSLDDESSPNENFQKLSPLQFSDLLHGKPAKISNTENISLSENAQKIIDLVPDKIDAVFSKHGETLRFCGLPFARIRKFSGEEKIWFGAENKRQILNEKTLPDFSELLESLKNYRRFDAPSKRHVFYTLAPESWLEANLRRNIRQLDGNLILSPLHTQFRAGRERIDLLALRTDGRLVIVELKTSADREMTFQALDYWRKIEIERRAGNLEKAKIFGERKIKNESALVYLAAPMFEFHRDLEFLAATVAPEIEIYRFDLNQNWRENLQVLRQKKFTAE
jgi:hypothetical protein